MKSRIKEMILKRGAVEVRHERVEKRKVYLKDYQIRYAKHCATKDITEADNANKSET